MKPLLQIMNFSKSPGNDRLVLFVLAACAEAAFDQLIVEGEDPETIIRAAATYAEKVKAFSNPAFIQQSDNFLDPDRGEWRNNITAGIDKPSGNDAQIQINKVDTTNNADEEAIRRSRVALIDVLAMPRGQGSAKGPSYAV